MAAERRILPAGFLNTIETNEKKYCLHHDRCKNRKQNRIAQNQKNPKNPFLAGYEKSEKKAIPMSNVLTLTLGGAPRVPAMLMLNILFRPVPRTHISFSKSFKFFLKL